MENFDNLADGRDENGEPVYIDEYGQSWGAILIFAEADWEQGTVGWGLPSYNSADECCGWCQGNRSSRPITDMSESANWRPTEKMTNEVSFDVLCLALNQQTLKIVRGLFCHVHGFAPELPPALARIFLVFKSGMSPLKGRSGARFPSKDQVGVLGARVKGVRAGLKVNARLSRQTNPYGSIVF